MISLAVLPSFARMFPNFQEQCVTLYTLLLPLAGLLLVIGIVAEVQHSRSGRSMLRLIAMTLLLTMTIAFFGEWTDLAKEAMQTVVSNMAANPEDAARRYIEVLVSKEVPTDKSGWFGLPSSATRNGKLVETLIVAPRGSARHPHAAPIRHSIRHSRWRCQHPGRRVAPGHDRLQSDAKQT